MALRWSAPAAPLPCGIDLSAEAAVDAYLAWDLLSRDTRHADLAAPGDTHAPVIAELPVPATAGKGKAKVGQALSPLAGMAGGGPELAAALRASVTHWPGSRIHTAVVPLSLRPALVRAVNQGLLLRFQMGAPCAAPVAVEPVEGQAQKPGRNSRHTLGIIDDGCCLLHEAFRSGPGGSRFAWVWDQEPARGATGPWKRHAGTGGAALVDHGVELSRGDLETLLPDVGLGESAERRGYADRLARADWGEVGHTHGARVLHLMAGMAGGGAAAAYGQAGGPGRDEAAQSPIVFVQLPRRVVEDTSGHSIPMQVLAGARYIVARSGVPAGNGSTTVCVALGGTAGPHDGSTMAEEALGELAGVDNVAVVAAAGNLPQRLAGDGGRWLHAERAVRKGRPGRFLVHVSADNPRHAFVELWLPDLDSVTLDAFRVSVTPPAGPASPPLAVGGALVLATPGARPDAAPCAGLVFARRVAQGRHGTLVLLAVGPTGGRTAAGATLACPGLWTVRVQSTADSRTTVHAWVERDDVLGRRRRPQQTWFERDPKDADAPPYVNDDLTLSSLAHDPRVTVAGGYVRSNGRELDGHGRSRRLNRDASQASQTRQVATMTQVDEYLAPTARGDSLPMLAVPGFFSGSRDTLGGSSAAAPQVARWIANGRNPDELSLVGDTGKHRGRIRPPRPAAR